MFVISKAHLSCFSAAYNNFSRLPELLVAATRRINGVMTWHFFDDTGILQLLRERGSAQGSLIDMFALSGFPVSPEKHQEAVVKQVHLGVFHDFSKTAADRASLNPKDGRIGVVICRLRSHLSDDWMSSSEAASIRGDLNWLATSSLRQGATTFECRYGLTYNTLFLFEPTRSNKNKHVNISH